MAASKALENNVFGLTNAVDFKNDFDLIRQMRHSAGSIMDNIAEGFGRSTRLEFINSLSIAQGEANELGSQIYRATDRRYISTDTKDNIYKEADLLIKKLGNFINYLNGTDIKDQKFKNR